VKPVSHYNITIQYRKTQLNYVLTEITHFMSALKG